MKLQGIERQTLSVAAVPILILALILEGYFTYTRFTDIDHALTDRAKLISQQLAAASEYPVFAGNSALLQQQVDSALTHHDVKYIAVFDSNSKRLAGAGRIGHELSRQVTQAELSGRVSLPIQEERSSLWYLAPIHATEVNLEDFSDVPEANVKPLGWVTIEFSKERLNTEKFQVLIFNLVLLLLVLVTTMLIATVISRKIVNPILGMRDAIRRIGDGMLETRLSKVDIHELNELATGINQMARELMKDRNTLQQRIDLATKELRQQKEAAERANHDKSRFLAAASHDLRQPMHALGLFVGELHARSNTDAQKQIVSKVEESVEALSGLLDSLLDISKLDAGVVVPQMQPVDVESMLHRLQHDFSPLVEQKHIRLKVRAAKEMLRSDPVLLERILLNLIGNAIRYTPPSGSILVACRKRGDNLRIEVRDSGIGIPHEQQQNIFQEFVQLENNARERNKGLGLGLSIVERLSKLLDHPLELRSAPQRGSTFSVTVPLARSRHGIGEGAGAGHNQLHHTDKLEGLQVLVVDDDMLVRAGTAGILASWGCTVEVAEGLQEFKERYLASNFDLIICDYRLPDGNGMQLADLIEQRGGAKPAFILISGDTAPEILQSVTARGLHLLHKPVRPAKLRSLIVHILS